ncbi:MAG: SCP2 sterol-binding domain-containing protein [Candidatus Competibacteraceae bacterium]
MTLAVIAIGLEAVLDPLLRLDPEIPPRLAALDGAVIALEVDGLGVTVYLLPGASGIRVLDWYEGEPTVRIRGAPLALARQWLGQRASSDIKVAGDVTVGRELQTILARLDVDWEELGSRIVGDAAARQIGRFWGGLRGWRRQTGAALRRDGIEYLQQELRAVPSRAAVEQYLNAVDTLREDADRLTARLERLRRRLAANDPD